MKKFTAILFAALILISGMNPVFSAHLCGESVAAIKWSFSGEHASCGMSHGITTVNGVTGQNAVPESNKALHDSYITQECCHNITAVYKVDDNYSPSSFDFNMTPEQSPFSFTLVTDLLLGRFNLHFSNYNPENSPGNLLARSVSLPDLCTFRI